MRDDWPPKLSVKSGLIQPRDAMLDQVDPGGARRDELPSLKLAILEILKDHKSRTSAIDRRRLGIEVLREVGYVISDREIREAIQELRGEDPRGAIIMSSSGASGYWLAQSIQEIQAHYREERSRALSILVRIRAQLQLAEIGFDWRAAKKDEGLPQMDLFG